jgi:uncharacterized protein (TIGR01370 family)
LLQNGFCITPPSSPNKLTLEQVRSFAYVIAPLPTDIFENTILEIWNSPYDMVILGNYGEGNIIYRPENTPSNNKLIIGYIDIAKFWDTVQNPRQPWLGNKDHDWVNQYTVQYWDSNWKNIIYKKIDDKISGGFDGIFLDDISAYTDWISNNKFNNSINPNASQEMFNLLVDIKRYIDSKKINRPFYIIGNNPDGLALEIPKSLDYLDAIFNEALTYLSATVINPYYPSYYTNISIQEIYKNRIVFGNDYPPLNNNSEVLKSFIANNNLSWIPSATTQLQTKKILTSGPHLFTATPSNNIAIGKIDNVNYLSGGDTLNAKLVGGDIGDIFIGGKGSNIIIGGSGDDVIYAHPPSLLLKNKITISYNAINKNSSIPELTIFINEKPVLANYTLTTSFDGSLTSELSISTDNIPIINSIKILGTNLNLIGSGYPVQYSNLWINNINHQGNSIPLKSGTWSNNVNTPGLINNNDTAIFNNLNLINGKGFPTNTSNTIDGGGGINTVIYGEIMDNYIFTKQGNGSLIITSKSTTEGPDTLTNINTVKFKDSQISLK